MPSSPTEPERHVLAAGEGDEGWAIRRWPATVTLLACIVLYQVLPTRIVLGPKWLVVVLEAIPILFLTFGHPYRHPGEPRFVRWFTIGTIAVVNLFNVVSIIMLIDRLLNGHIANGRELVYSAVSVWFTNCLIFGLWFWELDRGGPAKRHTIHEGPPDFLFPQMVSPEFGRPGWMPKFTDYLYIGFTNATAFSPTDTMPLTTTAKWLMSIESLASMATVVVVAARAVNILQG